MTPLTPSSDAWGTIVCDFCQKAPVSRAGYVCWNCQSYLEYLEWAPCDCAHNPFFHCRCNDECPDYCPAPSPYPDPDHIDGLGDGDEPVKAGEGACDRALTGRRRRIKS